MIENLKERGCDLLGIESCPTIQAQIDRMKTNLSKTSEADQSKNLITSVHCYTMADVYDNKLDKAEKARIERLEIFDEFEEWVML